MVAAVLVTSKPRVEVNERANVPNTSEDWTNNFTVSPEYAAYRTRFINILEQIQDKLHGHLGQMNTAFDGVQLSSPEAISVHAVPYRSKSARGLERWNWKNLGEESHRTCANRAGFANFIYVKEGQNLTILCWLSQTKCKNDQRLVSIIMAERMHWFAWRCQHILQTSRE